MAVAVAVGVDWEMKEKKGSSVKVCEVRVIRHTCICLGLTTNCVKDKKRIDSAFLDDG